MRMRREFCWGRTSLQCIFSSQDDERYTMQLESLDLVALWEGISGDGGAILPVLVLPKGQMM